MRKGVGLITLGIASKPRRIRKETAHVSELKKLLKRPFIAETRDWWGGGES